MPNWASMRQNLGGSSSGQPPAADTAAPAYQPPQTSQYQPPQPQQNDSCNSNSPKAQNFGMQNDNAILNVLPNQSANLSQKEQKRRQNDTNGGNQNTSHENELFCAGIPESITEDGFRNWFSENGIETGRVKLVQSKTNNNKIAFVSVENSRMIELAVRQMHNLELGGQRILVKKNEKRPAEPRNAPFEERGCDIADKIEKSIGSMAQNFANVINHQEGTQTDSNQNKSPYSSYNLNGHSPKQQNIQQNGFSMNKSPNAGSNQQKPACSTSGCQKPSLIKCQVCKSASYCSKECSFDDWPVHHSACVQTMMQNTGVQNGASQNGSFKSKVVKNPAIPAPHASKIAPLRKMSENEHKMFEGLALHVDSRGIWITDSNEINVLNEEISAAAKILDNSLNENYDPKVNDLVLAKFQGDWCRATVLNQANGANCQQKCKVFFFDYGNFDELEKTNIYQMPESLTQKPQILINIAADLCEKLNLSCQPYNKVLVFDPVYFGSCIVDARQVKIDAQ